MKMQTQRYEFILEAVEPIAHHSEVFGNQAVAMRRRVRQPDGTFADVPVVTGDTMRHKMREAASYAFLDAAGQLEAPALSEAALRLLFAGGMVTGRGDGGVVQIYHYRTMADLLPHLALFGGCAGNRVIPGRLTVSDAVLICSEQERFLPAWVTEWLAQRGNSLSTCRSAVEEVQRVRMDPAMNPSKRLLLDEQARAHVEGRLLASETARASADDVAAVASKSTMMPRMFERIVQGSLFFWKVEATCYNDLDLDTFLVAVAAFLYAPRVGGKQGTGHGLLRAVAANRAQLNRPAERTEMVDPGDIAPRAGELFRQHVGARKSAVKTFLDGVDA